jgi:maltooligosyltrehalose trehalohydrolase
MVEFLHEQAQDVADLNLPLGASYLSDGRCNFQMWAPFADRVELHLLDPQDRLVKMERKEKGYYQVVLDDVPPGSRYVYRLNGDVERPDPASRLQPQGVHGPSAIVDSNFAWEDDAWHGLPLQQYILYELHVGTYTEEGTFDAIIPYLDQLVDLGITAVELMPIAQFPGERNWGYDTIYPFAIQNSYGGPEALKRLVNACHQRGLAVAVDVVYNHFGPEGNYMAEFGPYFTDRHKMAWGAPLNYDGPDSDEVRRYFIENALYLVRDCHVDMLRLDAVDNIFDDSAFSFIEELAAVMERERVQLNRQIYLVAETSTNDPQLVRPREMGGKGIDGQWNDEFHHALHTLLTGETIEYYSDYIDPDDSVHLSFLLKAYREGYIYSGQYSPRMKRRHGKSSREIPAHRFVVFLQNHDHVGNRRLGERISHLVSFDQLKLAAGVYLLSPYLPLLFMGEEHAEIAPFLYFISHSDPDLIEAVRTGRREDFAEYKGQGGPPDPQAEETFQRSKIHHALAETGEHRELREFYKELIRLRKCVKPLSVLSKDHMEVSEVGWGRVMYARRWFGEEEIFALYNFEAEPVAVEVPVPKGGWVKLLDSAFGTANSGRAKSPDEIQSDGRVSLTVEREAFVLYARKMK